MKAEVYAASKAQNGRANEDHYVIGRGVFPMFAVADGAGNAQRAARRATDQFLKLHAETEIRSPQALRQQATWKNWIRTMDSALLGGGQSTFCGFTLVGDQNGYTATGVSVGDTRFYLLPANGEMEHVTAIAKKARLGSGQADPVTFHIELRSGDLLLMLSDGAYSPIRHTDIAKIALQAKLKHLCEVPMALIDRAGKHGLADDATALVVRVS